MIGAIAAQKVEMTSMLKWLLCLTAPAVLQLDGWLVALYDMGNTTFTDITILLSIVIGGMTFAEDGASCRK